MAYIQIRIDLDEKRAAQSVLTKIGLTLSAAIKIFLKQVVREQRLPFSISVVSGSALSASEITADENSKTNREKHSQSADPSNSEPWTGFSSRKIG